MGIPISYHCGEDSALRVETDSVLRSRIPVSYVRFTEFVKRKARQVAAIVTQEDLRTVLTLPQKETPEDSNYAIGDVIHTLLGGSVPAQFKIYDVKSGGYGIVYTVLNQNTLTPYCLKTPRHRSPADVTRRDTLEPEARVWLRLAKHPNIVYAHSLFDINGSLSILLEYVPGGDVSSRIHKGALSLEQALDYGIQFCRGMQYAQTMIPGFIHGDIKPSNCLLTPTGILKIADFGHVGLSKKNVDKLGSPLLGSEYCAGGGTPAYMARELLDGSCMPDSRSDIYAFGIMLYEMLVGRRPHKGRTYDECLEHHRNNAGHAAIVNLTGIPQALRDLIISCTDGSREHRPESFYAIEAALTSILGNIGKKPIPVLQAGELSDTELINRGASLSVLGQYDEALACFESAWSCAESPLVLNYKAQTLMACDRASEAAKCLDRALRLNPGLALTWNNKGRAAERLGNTNEALRCFERSVALDPRLGFAWNNKGRVLSDLGKSEAAFNCVNRTLAIDPHQAEAYNNKGVIYRKRGLDAEAQESFKKAVELNPSLADAYENLGDVSRRLGLADDAMEAYRQALNLAPDRETTTQKLGVIYREIYCASLSPKLVDDQFPTRLINFLLSRQTDPQLVISSSLELLVESGFDPVVLYLSADIVYRAIDNTEQPGGELADALAQVNKNLFDTANRQTRYWLGKLFYGLDLFAECTEVFKDSVRLCGPDARSLYYIAACHEVNARYAAALENYRQVLSLDSQCSLTRKAIERVEAKLNTDVEQQTLVFEAPIYNAPIQGAF